MIASEKLKARARKFQNTSHLKDVQAISVIGSRSNAPQKRPSSEDISEQKSISPPKVAKTESSVSL